MDAMAPKPPLGVRSMMRSVVPNDVCYQRTGIIRDSDHGRWASAVAIPVILSGVTALLIVFSLLS
jgi:hypothetical protein